MKFTRIHIIFIIWSMVVQLNAQQAMPADTMAIPIPTLEMVLDAAMNYSPYLKSMEKRKEIISTEIQSEKRKWLDHLFIEGAANYGVFDQVVFQNQSSSSVGVGSLMQSEQTRYYAGVGVKIPISSLSDRWNLVKGKRLGLEQVEYELNEAQNQLRTVVIESYYNLIYYKESMQTFFQIYQTMHISHLKAEMDVLNGRMNLNDFALMSSTVGKSKDDYNKAKNMFYAQYYKLQELTGVKF